MTFDGVNPGDDVRVFIKDGMDENNVYVGEIRL
jgi:hypothetical protein